MKALLAILLLTTLSPDKVHTPSKGSPERKAILNTLREDVKQRVGLDVIFVVDYLKVHNGWAYAITSPQSRDGKRHPRNSGQVFLT